MLDHYYPTDFLHLILCVIIQTMNIVPSFRTEGIHEFSDVAAFPLLHQRLAPANHRESQLGLELQQTKTFAVPTYDSTPLHLPKFVLAFSTGGEV